MLTWVPRDVNYANISTVRRFTFATQQEITKTRLFKYTENFTTKKKKIFRWKQSDIFHISAQSIDYGYSLELLQQGGSNEYPQSLF